MAPHTLTPHIFSLANQAEFQSFDCGTAAWELSVAEWIRGDGVKNSLARGSTVWIYRLHDGTIVGYGSVGTNNWQWPAGEIPSTELTTIIPSLALHVKYQGGPSGVSKAERYSTQIMDHVLSEAFQHHTRYVVLEVHSQNLRAERFYESYDFVKSQRQVQKTFGGVIHIYNRMYLRKQ